jgi:dihydroorotase
VSLPANAGIAVPLAIRGGTVVDASGERRADVVVADGIITAVGPTVDVPAGAQVLDATGALVAPGLVDLHTHLREPGGETAETIETGARAAALGGFTAVVAMPNTDPPIDSAAVAADVFRLARGVSCQVAVAGAITVGRDGEHLAPMAELAALGVMLFTDDGSGVQDGGLMLRALAYARGLGVVLAQHCEDAALSRGGHMHEGDWSSRMGVPGVPAAAEEAMVARDIALVRHTRAPMHFLHVSTAASMALVAAARAEGLPVTAEVTPHHLSLTDACLAGYDTRFKVNPPLRTDTDVAGLRQACAAGVVDAVATDHAPHPPEAKDAPLDDAPPGMLGLQTAWPVTLQALTEDRSCTAADVVRLLSWSPARVGGLTPAHGGDQGGPVAVGAAANLCVLDPAATWTVDAGALASRSRNSPWDGRTLTGAVRHTVFRGEPVVVAGEAQR